jgi:TRAP-type C4-dicarboxylate transport system permease small subunit
MPLISKSLGAAEAVIISISRFLNNVGAVVLVVMMLLTVTDVFMRYILNSPILGSVEITKYMMVSLAFFGMGWCAVRKAHVKVDLLVSHFKPKIQAILDSVTCFFSLSVFSLISFYGFLEAGYRRQTHEASTILQVPSYPFYLVLGIGSTVLCLVLITNLVRFIMEAVKK